MRALADAVSSVCPAGSPRRTVTQDSEQLGAVGGAQWAPVAAEPRLNRCGCGARGLTVVPKQDSDDSDDLDLTRGLAPNPLRGKGRCGMPV